MPQGDGDTDHTGLLAAQSAGHLVGTKAVLARELFNLLAGLGVDEALAC